MGVYGTTRRARKLFLIPADDNDISINNTKTKINRAREQRKTNTHTQRNETWCFAFASWECSYDGRTPLVVTAPNGPRTSLVRVCRPRRSMAPECLRPGKNLGPPRPTSAPVRSMGWPGSINGALRIDLQVPPSSDGLGRHHRSLKPPRATTTLTPLHPRPHNRNRQRLQPAA